MKTTLFTGILFILSIALSNCGFYLKNDSPLKGNINELALVSENIRPEFMHALKRKLQQADISINNNSEYQLNILRLEESRRAISNNNLTAKPTETQLNYRLSFSLFHKNAALITPSQIQRSKEYPNNNTDIAGMLDEERFLSEAAQEELIELLLRRIARVEVEKKSTELPSQ